MGQGEPHAWLSLPHVDKQLESPRFWDKKIQTLYRWLSWVGTLPPLPGRTRPDTTAHVEEMVSEIKFSHLPKGKKSHSKQHTTPKEGLCPTNSWYHTTRDWIGFRGIQAEIASSKITEWKENSPVIYPKDKPKDLILYYYNWESFYTESLVQSCFF